MNIYLLVEGRRTESKVYPLWLSYLLPGLRRIDRYDEVENNNYFLFSAGGYPAIRDDIRNAAADINSTGKYTYLVICLDADECTVEERKKEIAELFDPGSPESVELKAQPVIIIQNRCFETWFLGNRRVYSRNPQDEDLKAYTRFYNVSKKDPEVMPNKDNSKFNSISQFHIDYLKRMLREKNIKYSKSAPREVGEPHYIEALQERIDSTGHLGTLKIFFDFCKSVKAARPYRM